MNAIRRNLVIEISVLPHRSAKFAFSPENSLKPVNKQLLQQARWPSHATQFPKHHVSLAALRSPRIDLRQVARIPGL